MMTTTYRGRMLVLWMTLTLAPVLHAADLYVATDGNDTNPGTVERPFATLDKGAAAARPGDTVWIKPGNYLPVDVIWLKSGAPGARLPTAPKPAAK